MRRISFVFILTTSLICFTNGYADRLLQDLEGRDIALSSLKGKWVFINYWASWCQPCLDEIQTLNQFYDKNKSGNVALFAVNYDALSQRKQELLIKKFNIHYPSLNHHAVSTLNLGDVNVVPVTFVLNPQGELSTTLYGGQTIKSLNAAIITPRHLG